MISLLFQIKYYDNFKIMPTERSILFFKLAVHFSKDNTLSNITHNFTVCIEKLLIGRMIFLAVSFNFREIINDFVLFVFIVSLFTDDHCSM